MWKLIIKMSKKRQREQKTINEKYEIIECYEKLVANGEKHTKSKVVAQFKLAQLSSLKFNSEILFNDWTEF